MTLAWGVVGTGKIARRVGGFMASHPGHRVAAVSSRSLERAQALATDLGGATAYDSFSALVEDPSVQAVYVATPHAQHAEVVEIALLAGRAVLCEKAMTPTLAETERLVALATSSGTFLMEGLWMRFNPLVQLLTSRLDELGELRSLHASFGFVATTDESHRLWSADNAGGALLDLAPYTVDLARLLLGEPSRIEVTGTVRPNGVDEEESVLLEFPSGARALLDTSLVAQLPGHGLLVGTRGTALLAPSFHAPTQLVLTLRGREPEVHELADRYDGFRGELDEVRRCVEQELGQSTINPLTSTVATMRVLEQIRLQLPVS